MRCPNCGSKIKEEYVIAVVGFALVYARCLNTRTCCHRHWVFCCYDNGNISVDSWDSNNYKAEIKEARRLAGLTKTSRSE